MARKNSQGEYESPKFLLYRRLAIGFLCLTVALILVIGVVTFWTATITVVPSRAPVETTFRVVVVQGAEGVKGTLVPGAIDTALITGTAEVPVPTTERVEGKAKGKVTIKNTSSREQPLVVKTRFITKDGILFRLTKNVIVPAKGSVEASVEADESGTKGDIGPSRFTIPGLNPTLQELIYAESSQSMTGGLKMIGVVSQEQIDRASEAAKAQAVKSYVDAHPIGTRVSAFSRVDVLRTKVEEKVGEKSETVHGETQVRITVVRISTEHLEQVAAIKLRENVGGEVPLLPLPLTLDTSLDAVDVKEGRAAITVHTIGYSAVGEKSPLLAPDRFVGKSHRAIVAMLRGVKGVASVQVSIRPFFLFWAPYLKDHINVVVKSQ